MANPPPSFGRQLNDQLPRIQTVVQDHIGFLGDVREYLKERVALERQYGSTLQVKLFISFFILLEMSEKLIPVN